MPINRKPKATSKPSEDAIKQFIEGGGSEPIAEAEKPTTKKKKKQQAVTLRIPGNLLEQVDALVAERALPTTRHQWLLEAIAAQVKREAQS